MEILLILTGALLCVSDVVYIHVIDDFQIPRNTVLSDSSISDNGTPSISLSNDRNGSDSVILDDNTNTMICPQFDADQSILPDHPELNEQRRTVVISRDNFHESFGFALQSYTFQRLHSPEMERITYVDYVRQGSPASRAGIRRGDVIVAVNGRTVVGCSHTILVDLLSRQLSMRLVVLFQNVSRIISLQARALQLQYILVEKQKILDKLIEEENNMNEHGLSSSLNSEHHSSVCSSISSTSPNGRLTKLEEDSLEEAQIRNAVSNTVSHMSNSQTNMVLVGHQVALTHLIRVDNNMSGYDEEMTRL